MRFQEDDVVIDTNRLALLPGRSTCVESLSELGTLLVKVAYKNYNLLKANKTITKPKTTVRGWGWPFHVIPVQEDKKNIECVLLLPRTQAARPARIRRKISVRGHWVVDIKSYWVMVLN